ncbi:hypothetical protein SAMN05216517_10970 [Janthinobacterium sp. OK676]|uniref:hypothetical protein n=1 Tax=Janthinobacterium sp. OK676 TaxID=1855295 RepID=UPI00088DE12B|nr:hypothetical protein [Janthinobacterium sp. OK676]SDN23555.1 hypothetical protein SAMN05216517_10970 [Janthinobacterium sp. OK676]
MLNRTTTCRVALALYAAMLCAATCAASDATPRVGVNDPKVLMLAAIDAPDGRAAGMLTGELADAITRRFSATSAVFMDVTTLARYAQDGCRRLNVRFWQEGVRLAAEQAPHKQTIDIGINYCRNGLPPASLRLEKTP